MIEINLENHEIVVTMRFTDKQLKDRKRRRVKQKAARALRAKRNRARKK